MTDPFDRLQQLLRENNTLFAHTQFRRDVEEELESMAPVERARTKMLLRLSQVAEKFDDPEGRKSVGTSDFLVLVRQVIRAFSQPLDLPSTWWEQLRFRAFETGLYEDISQGSAVTINAAPWKPTWLADANTEEIGRLAHRRTQKPALGDGMLASLPGKRLTTYRSEAQKVAVDAVLHAPPGASLLVTLPTGGGKSMCILLPAWLASGGGNRQGGTTIVVVPTVSLAIDQQDHLSSPFAAAVSPAYRPHALLGSTAGDERIVIYEGIRQGTLPILYTSPESLLNNRVLHDVVLEAADKGFLNWLVIDEAHMVEQWGAGFRTEFQLLAAFRRQLLERTRGRLRTLLLSATVSAQCCTTLSDLFGNNHELATVMANQLRPEISYWLSVAADEDQRRASVLEALRHLPRPAILYVTRPRDANEWFVFLGEQGFERLAAYTGETAPEERVRIMREWARNDRDLMIATAAFGLGVDKDDVRTVIHATLPENVDRFYQEVGRGGRDGCQSISLLCTVLKEDIKLARSMSLRSRITVEKAYPRWDAMWKKRKPIVQCSTHFLLDLEAAPAYNPEMNASDTHRNWNEHILLLMQRAGLLEIFDANPERETREDSGEPPVRRWLHIELMDNTVTYSEDLFAKAFERQRQLERDGLATALEQIRNLAHNHGGPEHARTTTCIGRDFARVYPFTAHACGGCPSCRRLGYDPVAAPVRVESDIPDALPVYPTTTLAHRVASLFEPSRHRKVYWEGVRYPFEVLLNLLPALLEVGFTQFILPTEFSQSNDWLEFLLEDFSRVPLMPRHRLLTDAMLRGQMSSHWTLYKLPSVIVYPLDPWTADQLYRSVKVAYAHMPLVHIVPSQLYLASEYGRFLEKVEGLQESIDKFGARLQRRLETL